MAKLSLKQKFACFVLGLCCIALTVISFAPAVWLGSILERQTDGRLALGDAQGSLWNGSAFIGVAANKAGELTPLLPGRFEWHLSPIILLGQVEFGLKNTESLQQAITVSGNLNHVQVSPSAVVLPADRLSALGAPLNTVKPSGKMTLSWSPLSLTVADNTLDVNGSMKLEMTEIASALSPIKPLGSYVMDFVWHGQQADLDLKTVQGPLLLSGRGGLNQGRLHFSGQAQAEDGQEDKLLNLMNLLGQRRAGADKNVIALEFN